MFSGLTQDLLNQKCVSYLIDSDMIHSQTTLLSRAELVVTLGRVEIVFLKKTLERDVGQACQCLITFASSLLQIGIIIINENCSIS